MFTQIITPEHSYLSTTDRAAIRHAEQHLSTLQKGDCYCCRTARIWYQFSHATDTPHAFTLYRAEPNGRSYRANFWLIPPHLRGLKKAQYLRCIQAY